MTSSLRSPPTLYHAGIGQFLRGCREEEGVEARGALDARRRSLDLRVTFATAGLAGIGDTLGRVSVKDARELLAALLTARDSSSLLAGMSTWAGRAPVTGTYVFMFTASWLIYLYKIWRESTDDHMDGPLFSSRTKRCRLVVGRWPADQPSPRKSRRTRAPARELKRFRIRRLFQFACTFVLKEEKGVVLLLPLRPSEDRLLLLLEHESCLAQILSDATYACAQG